MAHDIKVGDKVRLVGSDWERAYEDLEVGDIVAVDRVSDSSWAGIWAGLAGAVGNKNGLYTEGNPGPGGDYRVELVTDPDIRTVTPDGEPTEDALRREIPEMERNHLFEQNVRRILNDIGDTLVEKNKAYGDSALNPIRVFSKADRMEQLYVRIDDKISRIQRGSEYPGDDTITDLIGYLTLLRIARESE